MVSLGVAAASLSFRKKTLLRLLKRAGFQAIRIRTGVGTLFFMASLDRARTHTFGRPLPARKLVEKLLARPFCLLVGHLGHGTEITVYAIKDLSYESGAAGDTNLTVATQSSC